MSPKLTVAGLWGRYLAANRRRLAPATLKHRNRCIRALLDWCPVDDPRKITPAMAARYAAHRIEGGLSPVTVASEMAALHAIFGWAVRKRLAKRNPFERVRRSPARERKPPRVLSDDEIARLLRSARGTVFHDVIYVFIRTGVSTQELAALGWEDVDFERRLVRIGGRPCEGDPQGKLMPRSIPMDERLAGVLARRPGGESDAPEEAGPEEDEGGEEHEEKEHEEEKPEEEEDEEDEDVCRTTLEILDRFGDTLEEARYRIDPRIVRVRKGFRELARRRRLLDEGGGPPGGPDESERERKVRVMSWLLDSFEGGPCRIDASLKGAAGRVRAGSEIQAESPYVFPTMLGGARRYNTALGVARCAARAGLGAVTPQVLRHTFAGRLVMNGVDATTLRQLMGFSGARQVACYRHCAPGGSIPRWHATAARRKELARRMRAAVEGFEVALPGPGLGEVIHRAAGILEDVAYYVERERAMKRREREKLRKATGLPPHVQTLKDLVLWLDEKEGEDEE